MEKLLIENILLRLKKTKTKLLISSLSYYAILAIIPTLFLSTIILDFFNISLNLKYEFIFNKTGESMISGFIITGVVIYMISRVFLLLLKDKFSTLKSIIYSVLFSFVFIAIFTIFLSTYTLNSPYWNYLFKFLTIFILLFILLYFSSDSNYKYSLAFSLLFSLIINTFLFFFSIASTFFLNYENYYGLLAPIFIIFLAIKLIIYIIMFSYISSEEFTKISSIKFIKR